MSLVLLFDRRHTDQTLINSFKDFFAADNPVTGGEVLMRWGNPKGSDKNAGVVLNRKQPLENCLDKEKILEILRINKIRRPVFVTPKPDSRYPVIGRHFESHQAQQSQIIGDFEEAQKSGADFFVEHVNLIKKYKLLLFDLNVFNMTKKVAVQSNTGVPCGWNYEEILPELDQDAQKVSQLALRAVYVLGLDFAMVHGGIDVRGRPVILDVSPTPVLNAETATLFHEQLKSFLNSPVFPLLLQPLPKKETDPQTQVHPLQTTMFIEQKPSQSSEFAVLLGADPEFVLKDSRTGKLTYPSEYLAKEGNLGYDERSELRQGQFFPLAEIRPNPEYCPVQLTENIRSILIQALAIIPPHIEWLAGSLHFGQYQIGGHIHFSNLKLNSRLLRALDNYLAIPIFLIEDPRTSATRRRQYGWIGSVRSKPHGGFEYRTPGSWLVSPEITLGCLCLAKIIASEYWLLRKDFFTDPELQKAFYKSKRMCFYEIFNKLWEDLVQTTLYKKYARHLTPITDLINTGSHWDEHRDLRKSWRLLPSE